MSAVQDVIVVVEDDPDDRHLLARAFGKLPSAPPLRFATDGEEAVALMSRMGPGRDEAARPILLLLDLKLPRRSGFEVLDWIKSQPGLKRVPVVILTSSRENSDLARAYDLGANSYLVKPTQPQALLNLVERVESYWLRLNEPAPF